VIFRDDNISSMDKQGELVLTLIASIAQEDNQSRRLNIRWGRQRCAENGTSELYRKKCYGYRTIETGTLEILESETPFSVSFIIMIFILKWVNSQHPLYPDQ
jgi:site-specific DNA recombinase